MTIRTSRHGTGWTVEAAFIQENGLIILAPADTKVTALAYVDLWAEICPTHHEPGDYRIEAVYAGNQFTHADDLLKDDLRSAAIAILKGDEQWCAWAHEEAIGRRAA